MEAVAHGFPRRRELHSSHVCSEKSGFTITPGPCTAMKRKMDKEDHDDPMNVDIEDDADTSLEKKKNKWKDFQSEKTFQEKEKVIDALEEIYGQCESRSDWETLTSERKISYFQSLFVAKKIHLFTEEVLLHLDYALAFHIINREARGNAPAGVVDQNSVECHNSSRNTMPDLVQPSLDTGTVESLLNTIDGIEGASATAPFLAIVQSSGYGKTKTVLDLARYKRRVVYLLCNGISHGWQRSKVMGNFIEYFKTAKDKNEVARHFLNAVLDAAEKYESPEALYKAQINEDGSFGGFYQELDKKWEERKRSSPSRSTKEKSLLIVAFDEAKVLTNDEDECSAYRCLRRGLKETGLFGLFLDTYGSTNLFVPEGANSDRGDGLGKFTCPFFELDLFDIFDRDCDSEPKEDHAFFLGRPLWKMQWQHRVNQDMKALVYFARHKLQGMEREGVEQSNGLLALFLCRFGLRVNDSNLAERMVASHLATLIGISVDRKILFTKYKSEPILAEASALATKSDSVRTQVLSEVEGRLSEGLLDFPKGDCGEMVAASWLCYTLDAIRGQSFSEESYDGLSNSFSKEVSMVQFVKGLCGKSMSMDMTTHRLLEEWAINVTHFCRPDGLVDLDILPLCWRRRVGIYLPAGEPGIDLLVAARRQSDPQVQPDAKTKGLYTSVRIQVKNYKNKIQDSVVRAIFDKLQINRCVPRCRPSEEPVSFAILMQVGTGSVLPSVVEAPTGRSTRAQTTTARQVQVTCNLSDLQKESGTYLSKDTYKILQHMAGTPVDNLEVNWSSFKFQQGELVPKPLAAESV